MIDSVALAPTGKQHNLGAFLTISADALAGNTDAGIFIQDSMPNSAVALGDPEKRPPALTLINEFLRDADYYSLRHGVNLALIVHNSVMWKSFISNVYAASLAFGIPALALCESALERPMTERTRNASNLTGATIKRARSA